MAIGRLFPPELMSISHLGFLWIALRKIVSFYIRTDIVFLCCVSLFLFFF